MTDRNSPNTAQRPAQPAVPHPAETLKALDAALDPRDYATTLVDGEPPYLHVRSRHADLGDYIYANDQFYFWPWGQKIAAAANPQAAAAKVSYVLAAPGSA